MVGEEEEESNRNNIGTTADAVDIDGEQDDSANTKQQQQQRQNQQQQQPQEEEEEEKKVVVYGPYYRLKSSTQTNEVAKLQVQSQEIWGKARRGSDIPQVQAYVGELPPNELGIEFTTTTPPDDNLPPHHVRWTGPREGVIIMNTNTSQEEYAKISVTITKNTQQ